MFRNSIGLLAIALVGLVQASCTKKSASDESLVTAIQSKLYADDATKAANIKVDVKNGTVTLSGDVPSSDVELEAMKVANATPGISGVNDQMKVNAAAANTATSTNAANSTPQTPPSSGSYPPASSAPAPASAAAAPPAATPAPAPASVPETTAPEPVASEPPPPPRPTTITVPAGTRLQVRMTDGIDSKNNSVGQTFSGSLDSPLVHGNRVVVPAGSPVTVLLTNQSSAGRIKGKSELQVRVTSLTAGGRTYDVASDIYEETGKSKGKQTAVRTGIGAAAGALIGGLAGGGKGAAIGAGVGGGAGIGIQVFTHGSQVKIPPESVLTFRLDAPLTVRR